MASFRTRKLNACHSVSASVPWPRKVTNRGDIREKQAAVKIAGAELAAIRNELSAEIAAAAATARALQPVMTALTAGLALIPLVLSAHERGKEILYPVAVVILGGLVSSTLLDMAVTPAVFFKFGRRAAERALESARRDPLGEAPAPAFVQPATQPTR